MRMKLGSLEIFALNEDLDMLSIGERQDGIMCSIDIEDHLEVSY